MLECKEVDYIFGGCVSLFSVERCQILIRLS
uniref:Uncharacterized protein n=1 Tax=Arundo donax TaxID=35708 RepID=A0A0A9H098_ARUDO